MIESEEEKARMLSLFRAKIPLDDYIIVNLRGNDERFCSVFEVYNFGEIKIEDFLRDYTFFLL